MPPSEVGIQGIDIPVHTLVDQTAYIRAVREGVRGDLVRQAVNVLGHRAAFVRLLGATASNLNRLYRRPSLDCAQSEALLDMLRLVWRTIAALGDIERASEWFDSALPALGGERPIDLCDTFEGRMLVRDAVRKIEYGEFP